MKRIIAFASITFLLAFALFSVAHADDNVTYEDVLASLQAYYAGLISKADADAVLNQYLSGQNGNSGSSGSSSSTSGSSSSSRNVRSVSQGTPISLATAVATSAPVLNNLVHHGERSSGPCGGTVKPTLSATEILNDIAYRCNTSTGQWVKIQYGSTGDETNGGIVNLSNPGFCSPSYTVRDTVRNQVFQRTNPNYDPNHHTCQ